MFAQAVKMRVVLEAVFQHVSDIHRGFDREQAQRLDEMLLLVAQTKGARGLAFVQMRQQLFQHGNQLLRILVAGLGLLAVALACYSDMAAMLGEKDVAADYRKLAESMAAKWKEMASDGDHYRLAFDQPGTWSM